MKSLPLFSDEVLVPVGEGVVGPLRERARGCTACKLSGQRTQVVFGAGNPERPPVLFIGESPGPAEDQKGEPFVGPSGQLLTRMITAMGYERSQVYLCTVVMCRTPNGRKPETDEISLCREYLVTQIRSTQPRVIVTLGDTATQALLKTTKKVGDLRGKWFEWEGIPVRPTYHPAYLLKPEGKDARKEAWIDLQAAKAKAVEPSGT